MRTHLEFVSAEFPPYPGEEEEINPGIFGKRLAEFLASHLPLHGFKVLGIGVEDWGIRIDIQHSEFALWIGCANYQEFESGFLCFVDPSTPYVRKWFNKIPAEATVEQLASAIESILKVSGKATKLRWWSEDEVRR